MKNIAFITDIHLDEAYPKTLGVDASNNLEVVLNDIEKRQIDTIIVGGDIGEAGKLQWFFDKLSHYEVFTILGNHDLNESVSSIWGTDKTKSSGLFYSLDKELFKLVFLDSSTEEVNVVQLDWLEAELCTEKKILLFIHHPVLSIDTPIDKMYPLKNREAVLSKLLHSQSEVSIFSGHYHMERKIRHENITQYVSPAISYQVIHDAETLSTEGKKFGYRILTINGPTIETEVIWFSKK